MIKYLQMIFNKHGILKLQFKCPVELEPIKGRIDKKNRTNSKIYIKYRLFHILLFFDTR